MITYIIIAITCLVSYQAFNNQELFEKLSFKPYKVIHDKEYYRLITNGFVHADWTHLFFNMLTLYFFGRTPSSSAWAENDERKGRHGHHQCQGYGDGSFRNDRFHRHPYH